MPFVNIVTRLSVLLPEISKNAGQHLRYQFLKSDDKLTFCQVTAPTIIFHAITVKMMTLCY